MNIAAFFKEIFKQRPRQVLLVCFLFMLSGGLELLSLAAIIPVLMGMTGGNTDAGAAGEMFLSMGIGGISLVEGLLLVMALMGARGVLLFISDLQVAKIAKDLEIEIREKLFKSVINARWQHLAASNLGRLHNIILREATNYSTAITFLGNFVSATAITFVLVTASLVVSWQAFVMFVIAAIPYLLISHNVNKRIRGNASARVESANAIGSQIGEDSSRLKYIKAAGMEPDLEKRFSANVRGYGHYLFRVSIYKAFIKLFPEFFGILTLGGIIIVSSVYLNLPSHNILFFLLLLFRAYRQLSALQNTRATHTQSIPYYERCQQMLEEMGPFKEDFASQSPEKPEKIKLQNVSFKYDKADEPALKNISLEIPSKGLFAFVGKSGAGKTTLGDLILGIILPDQGEIVLNDHDRLLDFNLLQWRQHIGYVPQDSFLVAGTLRDNILLGAQDKSEDNLINCAKIAQIDGFTKDLDDQYDTQVGDYGIRLSGGQKQRIALARALARKPYLLILDEATSALDYETEDLIQKSVIEIAKTMPVIVIAHRLSTIKNAQKIFVLDKGELKEEGTYTTLQNSQGIFQDLCERSG